MEDGESKDELDACQRCGEGCELLSNIYADDCGLTTEAASSSRGNLPLNPCRFAGLRNIAALPAIPAATATRAGLGLGSWVWQEGMVVCAVVCEPVSARTVGCYGN